MRVTRWTHIAARIMRTDRTLAIAAGIAGVGVYAALGGVAAFIAVCAAMPVWIVTRALATKELARLPAYQGKAHENGDADALAEIRRIWTGLGASGRRADALSQSLLGEELALREKWAEARDAFLAVDLGAIPDVYVVNVMDWLAYTTAQAGDPLRALAIIDEAIAKSTDDYADHLRITRAKILVLLGRPAEAIDILEARADERLHDRALNQRHYWLALANEALGNDVAAREALERAASLVGPFQAKAREALAKRTPFRG